MTQRLQILAKYSRKGASSRLRLYQFIPMFEAAGMFVSTAPLLDDQYLDDLYQNKRANLWRIVTVYWSRMRMLLALDRDIPWLIQGELFPWLPYCVESIFLRRRTYLVDFDDAIFHRYDLHRVPLVRYLLGRKIHRLVANAALVIAGNTYLANMARGSGAERIETVPTVVDTERYYPITSNFGGPLIVGWIGTPKTSRYLSELIPVFERLQQEICIRFVAVGARDEDFLGTPIEVWPWSEGSEVASIQQFDVGIMPLNDSPWERGKCGYKLIQYMACGKPIIASPVGVNQEIVEAGVNGYLANTPEEWQGHLKCLLLDSQARTQMGYEARKKAVKHFSLQTQAPRLINIIRAIMNPNV